MEDGLLEGLNLGHGRMLFVDSLRHFYPSFFICLNSAWRGGNTAALDRWLQDHHVVDHWLQAIVLDTLHSWEKDPSGPNATLDEHHLWYSLATVLASFDQPEFRPVFTPAYPIAVKPPLLLATPELTTLSKTELESVGAELTVESAQQFRKRIHEETDRELDAYLAPLKRVQNPDATPGLRLHARITALRFAGLAIVDIVRIVPEFKPHGNPENAGAQGIKRFAASIGLTIPPKTATGCQGLCHERLLAARKRATAT